jgi:O-antigen/teichoic acid export membrane protein
MIRELFYNPVSRQTLMLFSAQVFGLVIGFLTNIFLAKTLEATLYGKYQFALSVLVFLSIFIEFGIFASGSRLLALNADPKKEKELIGTLNLVLGVFSLLFIVTVAVLSIFIDRIYEDKIGEMLLLCSLFSFSFLIPFFLDLTLKGSNHIYLLSSFTFAWKVLFGASIVILSYTENLTTMNALMAYSLTCLIPFMAVNLKLSPSFNDFRANLSLIRRENKVFGFKNYLGRALGTGSFYLDRILISYFSSAKEVGFYGLAFSFANPLNTFSTALSASLFKTVSDGRRIPSLALKINFVVIAVGTLLILAFGNIVIRYYLSSEYLDTLPNLYILTFAVAMQAAYQPFNEWLASNGYGNKMLITAKIFTFFNLVLNIGLIPFYGAVGASVATLVSYTYFFVHTFYFYRKIHTLNS